tara:strand:- start:57 stop:494 length:438 start_codon:yes stop_codon:yes gene_type:complete
MFGTLKRYLRKLSHPKNHHLLVVLILLIGLWLTWPLLQKTLKTHGIHLPRFHEGFEGQKELLMLHMDGCPHCVRLMPEWDAFTKENNTGIKTRAIERKEDPGLVQKHNVRGFPSILLLGPEGEKLKTYEGPRTKDGLLRFCKNNS